jgi:hypothetical protein
MSSYRHPRPEHLRAVTAQVRARSNGWCERCRRRPARVVHHKRYDNLGAETADDCLDLCLRCHGVVHGKVAEKVRRPQAPGPVADWGRW